MFRLFGNEDERTSILLERVRAFSGPTKTVYVAGPYTKGDVAINVRDAILAHAGYAPYVPHLSHFWHLIIPHGYKFWMALDMEWLIRCDILLRLPGESEGGDKEVEAAEAYGIPVVHTILELTTKFPLHYL
jgi:hypothetical protein